MSLYERLMKIADERAALAQSTVIDLETQRIHAKEGYDKAILKALKFFGLSGGTFHDIVEHTSIPWELCTPRLAPMARSLPRGAG